MPQSVKVTPSNTTLASAVRRRALVVLRIRLEKLQSVSDKEPSQTKIRFCLRERGEEVEAAVKETLLSTSKQE